MSLQVDPDATACAQKPDKAAAKRKKAKKRGSMADSLAVLRSSPKILSLALLVMSYGVSHRLFEFAWKGQLGVLYPSAQQYQVRRRNVFARLLSWCSYGFLCVRMEGYSRSSRGIAICICRSRSCPKTRCQPPGAQAAP